MKIDNRIWIVLTVIVIAALFAGGWFLGAQPQLDAMAVSFAQKAEAATKNAALEQELRDLAKAKEGLADLEDEVAQLQKAIPAGTNSSAFISALNDLAAAAGVTIAAIAMEDSQPYAPPAGDAPATTVADAGPADAVAPVAPVVTPDEGGAPPPATNDLITGDNFVVVPVNIDVVGPWQNTLNFIKGLQSAERLVLVTDVDSTRDGDEDVFKTTVGGFIYVLRDERRPSGDESADETDAAAIVETPAPDPADTSVPTDPESSVSPSPSETPAVE